MMIMPARRRRPKPLRGLALVLASAVICITSRERGLIWMTASDRRQFRNWPDGRHPQVGYRVSAQLRRWAETIRTNSSRKWRQWPAQRQRCRRLRPRSRDRADGTSSGETHVSRVTEDPGESVESERHSGPGDPTEGAGTPAGGRARFTPRGGCTGQSRAGSFRDSSSGL